MIKVVIVPDASGSPTQRPAAPMAMPPVVPAMARPPAPRPPGPGPALAAPRLPGPGPSQAAMRTPGPGPSPSAPRLHGPGPSQVALQPRPAAPMPTPAQAPAPAPAPVKGAAGAVAAPKSAAPAAKPAATATTLSEMAKLRAQIQAHEALLAKRKAAEADMRTVVMTHVDWDVTEAELTALLAGCGAVRRLQLARNATSGRHAGQAIVEFEDKSSVPAALKLSGMKLHEQPIVVIEKRSAAGAAALRRPPSDAVGGRGFGPGKRQHSTGASAGVNMPGAVHKTWSRPDCGDPKQQPATGSDAA
eukprot:108347-Chlamydomonas_euryale.AAC.1